MNNLRENSARKKPPTPRAVKPKPQSKIIKKVIIYRVTSAKKRQHSADTVQTLPNDASADSLHKVSKERRAHSEDKP
jgi:hypothetical protein